MQICGTGMLRGRGRRCCEAGANKFLKQEDMLRCYASVYYTLHMTEEDERVCLLFLFVDQDAPGRSLLGAAGSAGGKMTASASKTLQISRFLGTVRALQISRFLGAVRTLQISRQAAGSAGGSARWSLC